MENKNSPVILDVAVGIRRLAGDRELYQQIMEIFFSEAEEQVQTLTRALAENNAELIKRVAHSMKGAAANMGALRVQQTAFELEMMGTENSLEQAPEVFTKLKIDLAELTTFWQNQLTNAIE